MTRRKAELAAGREADLGRGAQWGRDIGELAEYEWQYETRDEAEPVAQALRDIKNVAVTSESNFGRTIADGELEPTISAILEGRHPCIGCGAKIDPRQAQIAAVAWMFAAGFQTQYTCLVCGTKNDLTIAPESTAKV